MEPIQNSFVIFDDLNKLQTCRMRVVQLQVDDESVDPLAGASAVDFLERKTGALVQDALGLEALVLIIAVGCHAGLETLELVGAHLVEDILTR